MLRPYAMLHLDHQLTSYLRSLGVRWLPFWKFIAARGMWGFLFAWIAFAVMGWMAWWAPVIPLGLSYMTLLITQAIVKRERQPFEKISGYKMWIRTYSFPSGHATESSAFALVLMLYPTFPSVTLLVACAIPLVVLGLLVVYSRIAVGVHYVTDVIAGMLLGALYALAFLRVVG